MPPPLVPPFASWTDSAERTRIDVALGGWLNRLRALVTRNAEKLAEVERVVETIRLVEGTATPLSTSTGRCPGIQYVADPFHGLEVHNLLRAIGLGEYVGSKESPPFGPVSPFLKARTADEQPTLTTQQIENIAFVFQYLKSLGGDESSADPPTPSSLPDFWQTAVRERNLRFLPCSDGSGRVFSVNIMLNEWLEHIRLASLFASEAWQRISGQLSRNEDLSDNDKRKLAMWIYSSIVTVEEFADASLWMSSANLELLAEMAVQIPFSWYSAAFTGALLRLGNRYRTAVEATGGKVVSGLLKRVGICSTTLLATYVRKADGSGGLVSDVLGHLAALGSRSELIKDQPQMVLPIVESLCGTAGRNLPEDEESTVEKLAALLRTSREHASVIATEPGAAAVAHFLVATSSPSAIAKLCRELLAATSSGPDLTLEEGIKLTQLFQVALYSRLESGTGPSQKTGLMEKVLTALRIARPVVRENMPARTILHTLESHDDAAHSAREFIARSYASTGLFWAAVAHSNAHKGDMEALSVRKSAESLAWDSIADVAEQTLNGGEPVETFQRAVLYTTNQCLAAAPTFGVKLPDSSSDLANLLRVTLQTVLFDTDALGLGATFFRNLNEELMSMEGTDGRKGDFSATTSHRILDRKTGKGVRPFFYSEMGRISRSVGTLLSRSWVIGQHDVVLDNVKRLQSFVTALCSQWSHCPFSQPETQAVEAYAQTATLFWDYLKMVLFAVVSILRTLVVEEIASPRRAASVSQSVIAADSITAEVFLHVLVIFRDLHFVASRMGSEGFGPWREVIVDIADWFGDRSAERGANDGARQPWGLDSALRNMFDGVLKVEQANPVRKSQELFNLLFARQTLPALDEDVVATELMPRIETLIRIDSRAPGIPTEDVELFEVAHGLSGQLFDHAGLFRSTALGFAPKYVALLFDGYPDKIDLDLIRRSYTSVIRGLSFGAAAGASDDVDITRDDVEAVDVATQLPPAEERNGGADMDDVEVIRLCLDRLYDEIDERSQALLQAAEKDGYSSTWIANRHKDAEFVVAIIEAVRNGAASNPEDDENAWAEFLRLPKGDLSRTCAERGQLVVMLIDQIRSVSLELLPELLDAIRDELLLTDRIERGDSPLWRFAFNAISSSRAFDATKKRYCVDWYLTLMKERRAPKQKHELDNMDIAERAEQTVVDQAKL